MPLRSVCLVDRGRLARRGAFESLDLQWTSGPRSTGWHECERPVRRTAGIPPASDPSRCCTSTAPETRGPLVGAAAFGLLGGPRPSRPHRGLRDVAPRPRRRPVVHWSVPLRSVCLVDRGRPARIGAVESSSFHVRRASDPRSIGRHECDRPIRRTAGVPATSTRRPSHVSPPHLRSEPVEPYDDPLRRRSPAFPREPRMSSLDHRAAAGNAPAPSKVDPETVTLSGYAVDRLYGPDTVETRDPRDASKPHPRIGEPGQFPFTRGVHSTMYRSRLWTMRQFAGFGSRRRHQPAVQVPPREREGHEGQHRTVDRVRPADADGPRLRRRALRRRGRPLRRRDRHDRGHAPPLRGHPDRRGHGQPDDQRTRRGDLGDVPRDGAGSAGSAGRRSAARCRTTSSRSSTARTSSSTRPSRA